MGIISIPKALREKLGDDGSEALVDVLNKQGEENKQSVIDIAEQRFETKLTKETSSLRSDFETKLAKEISSVREDVQKTRADLIRWMFIFWVGQIGVIIGILFTFYKIMS
jgi:hypothetical protein